MGNAKAKKSTSASSTSTGAEQQAGARGPAAAQTGDLSGAAAFGASLAADVDPEVQAEVRRLEQEMGKLAERNAWAGVERAYVQMESLDVNAATNPGHCHFLAAQASRSVGDTRGYKSRLLRSRAAGYDVEGAEAALEHIDDQFGTINLSPADAPKGRRAREKLTGPPLTTEQMPFAPDMRKSIEFASQELQETGFFSGMIPAGEYSAGGARIVVIAGSDASVSY